MSAGSGGKSAPSSAETAARSSPASGDAGSEGDDQDAGEVDLDALAEAYNLGLERERAGDLDAAETAYREALAIDPSDRGGVAIRLASMGRAPAPESAPLAYVATLFDQNALAFDEMLVDDLGYSVPLLIRDALAELELGPFARMLDLGCGTGLCAEALRGRVAHATGVDVSEGMLDVAYDKGDYDALYVCDAAAFLSERGDAADEPAIDAPWDLVIAADVLPYLGALEPLFAGAAAWTSADGVFAFSCETLSEDAFDAGGYRVGPKHRFAHSRAYILRLLQASGYAALIFEDIVVRYDAGAPVPGFLIIASRV